MRNVSLVSTMSVAALGCAILGAAPTAQAETRAQVAPFAAYSIAAPTAETPSGLVARAVIPNGAHCPALTVTGTGNTVRTHTMTERARPANTGAAFAAITVCSAPMPVGAVTARIWGHEIPARMPSRVSRLALLGDSGCRITSLMVQACADVTAWPLSLVSTSIAADHPDAVLFNGDFFYREQGCPEEKQDLCGSSPPPVTGMPFTDSAYGWVADVLIPMAPMLSIAPMIVTRGNHEACFRGGNGFFYLMDPRNSTSQTCSPRSRTEPAPRHQRFPHRPTQST